MTLRNQASTTSNVYPLWLAFILMECFVSLLKDSLVVKCVTELWNLSAIIMHAPWMFFFPVM